MFICLFLSLWNFWGLVEGGGAHEQQQEGKRRERGGGEVGGGWSKKSFTSLLDRELYVNIPYPVTPGKTERGVTARG